MSDGLRKAKEFFDKAKPRSKGSAGRESAEQSREEAVKTIARRREKVAELDAIRKENPGFKFKDSKERDRADKLQPGPKDYPEYSYDARMRSMMVPKGFDAYKKTEGGYFRGRTSENLGDGFSMGIDYPGSVMRLKPRKQ